MWLMIDYFCTLNYDDYRFFPKKEPETYDGTALGSREATLMVHAQVFVVADKYDVPGLKTLALQKFEWNAREDNLGALPKSLRQCLAADLYQTTKYVYEHTQLNDTRLRKAVITSYRRKEGMLVRSTKRDAWEDLLAEVPAFAVDYIEAATNIKAGDAFRPESIDFVTGR